MGPATTHGQPTYQLRDDGQWQAQQQHDPATPEGRLQTIRRLLAEDKPDQAHQMAEQWIEELPNHPLLVEAYLLRGDARTARRHYFKALFDYEMVLRRFPASEQFTLALQREFDIARLFAGGMKRRWLGMRIISADGEAEEIFIRIQERAPGSEVAHQASLALADFYFDRSQMDSAADAYDLFLINYPQSEHREHAMLRMIQANLATFKGPTFDSSGLIEASQRLKLYAKEYPVAAERLGAEALQVRIEESLALKMYHNGRWYERTDQPVSAAYVYQRTVNDYPHTAAARAALERLGKMHWPVTAPPVSEEAPAPQEPMP